MHTARRSRSTSGAITDRDRDRESSRELWRRVDDIDVEAAWAGWNRRSYVTAIFRQERKSRRERETTIYSKSV